ncbi:MAG: hypothetical protein L6Q97_16355 [Thermoanaerobaculia bacterium]|nr:hypothetical protein [Thermoanaerobaculia bacterium]
MKSIVTFFAFSALLWATQCQQNQKSGNLAEQVNTEITNLQAARQAIVETRDRIPALRTEINNIPASVKSDTSSGFAELQRQVEIFDLKTNAMVVMYDRVVPQLQKFSADVQSGFFTKEAAQHRYDSLFLTFKDYNIGVESTKKMLESMSAEAKRLAGEGAK